MSVDREALLAKVSEVLSPQIAETIEARVQNDKFASEFYELVLQNCYGAQWVRPGLPLRERSLITLAMLMASGQMDELPAHAQLALANGCTVSEIEEVVYHATAYAGFPKAHVARAIIEKTLLDKGLL